MRITVLLLAALAALVPPTASEAITRYSQENPFYRRSALSVYAGYGLPVGEFADDRDGDGNHESGALDWSVEIEHFFAPRTSIGAMVVNSTWQDKSIPDLETDLTAFAGFLRYVIVSRAAIHPYLRLAFGGQTVQFQDSTARYKANSAFMVQAGGGLIFVLLDHLSANAQLAYTQGFAEDSYVRDLDAIVGFDTKYWTLSGGLSIYFP